MTDSEKIRGLGTLAGGVAHEFNNILGGILACASFLEEHAALDPESRETLGMILSASRRATQLTRQLLGLVQTSKAEAEPFDLNQAVRELVRVLSLTFPREIAVETDLAPGLPPALGTPAQVHQALLNLCVNARDAMPGGGRLTLRTAPPSDRTGRRFLSVAVSDTGTGIPEEIRGRIFEPFFTTKPPGKGTGLGLSFVKSVADSLGGEVEVRTEPGKGSAFALFLPAAPVREPAAAPPAARPAGGRAERILVVDDDPVNRLILERILGGSGYR
ncbi:MAG: ATP-binding protein, partial [Planctomycetes bacterium]|nr:ATP-binding protein [Planctomycetota bacterium]